MVIALTHQLFAVAEPAVRESAIDLVSPSDQRASEIGTELRSSGQQYSNGAPFASSFINPHLLLWIVGDPSASIVSAIVHRRVRTERSRRVAPMAIIPIHSG